jgi:spore coat polysaccharide biosynthesis predicted glycosyltransferase SpsG
VYAAAHIGLPTVLLAHNDAGAEAAAKFEKTTHCCEFLGRYDTVSAEDIHASVRRIANDENARKRMSDNGKSAVDGKGLDRISTLVRDVIVRSKSANETVDN